MAKRQLPPQGVLRQLLTYDCDTGKLFWNERGPEWFGSSKRFNAETQARQWNTRYAGKEAFTSVGADGYLKGTISGVYYLAHRVIWKMETGDDPDEIDHISGVKTENRFANLRDVSRGENAKNLAVRSDNRFGISGVYRRGKTWWAHIRHDGAMRHLGTFKTKEEAIAARKAAEVAFGFHPNHGR
ncbi:HNH endonuclease signature motif containing protein [Paracoccus pantotrophus]|uniref:HNH endonuclease signature motif containing protein n=1 Tax=Paracoccus pantotrophus TaxID=82367 RepID=UPI00048C0872|nr:HNH endonuclease signature motif containing protein [Paracoccus pantotrophus]